MWMLCTESYAASQFFRLPCTLLRATECPQKTGLRRVNATTLSKGHYFHKLALLLSFALFKKECKIIFYFFVLTIMHYSIMSQVKLFELCG